MKKYSGIALLAVGLFMLFKMVRVSSFGFYRFGGVNTSAIVLVLLVLSAIAVVVKQNKFTWGCLIVSLCLLVLSLLLGTSLYFAYTSLTNVLLVLVPSIIGLGLIIKGSLEERAAKHS